MRDSSTRSFSTVTPYGMGDRGRRQKKRKLIIALIAVVCALILVFGFLILAEIFGWFEGGDPIGPGGTSSKLEFDESHQEASADIHKGDLILINSSFPYVFPDTPQNFLSLYNDRTEHTYSNGKTVYAYYTQNGATAATMDETARAALNAWADGFYKATNEIDLFVYDQDGYRSRDDQSGINSALVGMTEHHTGKVVDWYIYTMDYKFYNIDDAQFAGTYSWMYKNAHKYGFIHRYPTEKSDITGVTNEKYHFRYVGVPHATYMYENNLCLEEYLDLLRDSHSYKSEHLTFEDATNTYEVYYVAASSDRTTVVPVPKTDDRITYTVSGDNKEGFIVTVTIAK